MGTEAELARSDLHQAAGELRRIAIELDGVDEPRHGEELRGAAVERVAKDLQCRNDFRLGAVDLDRIDGRMACERRVVAVMPRQVGEERLHSLLVVVEPDQLLADLRAVRGDLVAKARVAKIEETLEVAIVEREARA